MVDDHQYDRNREITDQAQRVRRVSSEQWAGIGASQRHGKERYAPSSEATSLRREEIAPVLIDQLQRAPAAARDAGERIVGDVHVQAGLLGDQAVEVAQQRTAAGQHDTAL